MRLSKIIEILENKAIAFYKKNKDSIPRYILILFIILYAAGFIVHSVTTGLHNFYSGESEKLFTVSITKNISSLFTPAGIGTVLFGFLMFLLFSGKGKDLLSGYKTVKDKERGIEILPEGTHGTSGFMDKKELPEFLVSGSIEKVDETLLGKLENGDYVAMKDMPGMSKNVMVYGAPGTGKSRGFVMPFVMQAARRGESLVMVDPKAEFYEMYSGFLKSRGYTVKAYNLLDLFASDGWNCVMDTAQDITLVQRAAEIIIRNTSNENERGDFWEKAEKNLLMALLHYVQSLTYPGTDKLLPPEERSLGTIYKILSTTSVQELDARFRALPPDHPALPPYGIFRQAHKQIWGNIVIGLGNRLNVFQNKLVDDITKHNEIDLTLPGREKCAYFCIISDQDSSLEFLSSMFFSLMFVKLFDYARQQDNRRLPVCVNVLMDEFCNIALLDSKKIFSVARSRNINIQAVVQSIAQLSDRYPGNEWQEIVGDCDYQLFLGCNDVMTSEFFSKQCGEITVRVNNTNTPMQSFLDFLSPQKSYMQNKTSTGRALMLPIVLEILRKTKEESVTIETDENGALGLNFGSARYLLVTRPVNEFPKSELVFPTAYVSVSGLLPLLKHAAFAAETKGDKRELQGVTLRLTPGISTAEAMDQKRMASAVNRNAADGETEMKLHISAVNILFSLLSADKTVYAGTADQRAVFVCGDTVFSTVMMNKTGPDMSSFVKRLVPEYCAVAGAKELLNAIQTAAVCQLPGDDKCVNICFTPMGIRLSCAAYKRSSSAFVATLCDSPTPDVGFNYDPRIIEDFLSLTTGNVSVKLDKKGFMLLESADGVYLVTPRNAVSIVKPKAKPEKTEKAEKKTAKKTKKVA